MANTNSNKRNIAIGVASIFTLAMFMRIRRSRRNRNNAAASAVAAATTSERYAFPVAIKSETADALGLAFSEPTSAPPRLRAVTVLGMPEGDTNAIQTACVVVDAVTRRTSAGVNVGEDLFAAFTSDAHDEEALLQAVKAYASSSPIFQGTSATPSALTVTRLQGVAASALSLALPPIEVDPKADPKTKAAASVKAQKEPIDIQFSFVIVDPAEASTSTYVCVVPEAATVVSLIISLKDVDAIASRTSATAAKSAAADATDITAALRKGFVLNRAAVSRLVESAKPECPSATTIGAGSPQSPSPTSAAEEMGATNNATAVHHHPAVITNATMRFRAVLPTETTVVEDVRSPAAEGSHEVFLTVPSSSPATTSSTYARITYHPAMPATWEDDAAISDPSEKEDEYRRNLMRHFLGVVSNSITLHAIDISGRRCLWFGESNEGVCCRTYVCPNFDISGKKSQKRGQSQQPKGMTVIRWEGPQDQWEGSQKLLSNFLDYFQFQ